MVQSDVRLTGDQAVSASTLPPGWQHSSVDHEIFSTVVFTRLFKKSSCQFLANECAHY